MTTINIFYEEPDPDRWFKYDRYLRRFVRRVVRGKKRPGGVMMIAINLMKGLDNIGQPYRFNDYKYALKHPEETICIIGKPHVLFERRWKNPIIFGAGVFSHPFDHPDIFDIYPNLKKILVPGDWMRQMFEPYYGDKVVSWPVGIDTDYWSPNGLLPKKQVLIYDKLGPAAEEYKKTIKYPIINFLKDKDISYELVCYGSYKPAELLSKARNCRYAIVLSETETQGLAYQQILSTGLPILAWDRGGYWTDPEFYPHKVKFAGATSVPYWNASCGKKFQSISDFYDRVPEFVSDLENNKFNPRQFILDNLTLKKCAEEYLKILKNKSKP